MAVPSERLPPLILWVDGAAPAIARSAWVAPGAVVAGRVSLAENTAIWYSAVVRGDNAPITIGAGSNVQDGAVLHADPGFPLQIGSGVSVGHRAVLHGCTVEDDVLIGMGAIVMNGARIGAGSMVAAGALVPQNAIIDPGSLVAGVPGRIRRTVTAEERAHIVANAADYRRLASLHRAATS